MRNGTGTDDRYQVIAVGQFTAILKAVIMLPDSLPVRLTTQTLKLIEILNHMLLLMKMKCQFILKMKDANLY